MSSTLLRIAVVQLNPKLGQVPANIQRARELCSKLQPKTLDLVCFPEMAFTGYVFDDAPSIAPHLEQPRTGPTSQFCAELAKKLGCYVVAGYPEQLPAESDSERTISPLGRGVTANESESRGPWSSIELEGLKECPSPVGANSAIMYDRDGELVGGYRKTNLYDTDMTWAKAGSGFGHFSLPSPLGSLSLGICMDLNPDRLATAWSLEDGPYEVADHCVRTKTNVLLLLNSWLLSPQASTPVEDDDNDWDTLEYWAARLRPLWVEDPGRDLSLEPRETVVVVCNRSGEENGKSFAGTSALFRLTKGSGRPVLLDMMTKGEEAVKVWNVKV